jgi:hypothetical protein
LKKKDEALKSPMIEDTMPHQANAPSFKGTGIQIEKPFVNSHGVVIGDNHYNSEQSPLNNWSDEIDPAIMAGAEWVHPTNDIGWNTAENRELVEKQKKPQRVPFMHPDKDVSYGTD